MKAAQCPVPLEKGELLLQWYVPSAAGRLGTAVAHAGWPAAAGSVLVTVLLLLCAGIGAFVHEWMVLACLLFVLPASLLAGLATLGWAWVARAPRRWWVTSRRFLVSDGSQTACFAIDRELSVQVRSRFAIELTTGERTTRLSPLDALPELWGALLLAKGLSTVRFPAIDADAPAPTVTGAVCLHGRARRSRGRWTQGVLVLRPHRVTWIPAASGWVGDKALEAAAELMALVGGVRVRRLTPVYPLDPLFHRLLRCPTEASFDATLGVIAAAWGGGSLPMEAGRVEGSEVVFAVGEVVYRAPTVDHPAWPDIRDQLGLAD